MDSKTAQLTKKRRCKYGVSKVTGNCLKRPRKK